MSDIIGYKELTEQQKIKINTLKLAEKEILKLLFEILGARACNESKWGRIAFENIEIGFMSAVRQITYPVTIVDE